MRLSEEFVKKLAEISAGYLPFDLFDELINFIEAEAAKHFFDRTSESNLLRIISGRFDKASFLNDCIKYPNYLEILISISVNSNYLTDILVRDPENFYWISNPSNLNAKIDQKKFLKSLRDLISSYKTFQTKVNALRAIKRKELLRIGLKDILGISDLNETTEQLSTLAKVISSELFSICYSEILLKNGIRDKKKIKSKYCIIALGKLGGNELNYSSDIDLIIFYDKDQKISILPNQSNSENIIKEYFEILIEAIYLFIESASSITSSGFIYRVDFRLRPDGRTSALCGSLQSYLNYYESRGEDWERQMLIKAGFLSGDRNLYDNFINHLSAFIYPGSFSISPVEQIKRLKFNVEKNLSDDKDIKLQAGGIRDIEFSVQALQLINGRRFPEIRTGNTLNAIEKLFEKKLLSEKEKEILNSAYIFYRRIEHYLQLMNDKQTHTIPSKGEILEKLSAYLNFKDHTKFNQEVSKKRKMVRNIFDSIAGEEKHDKKEIKSEFVKIIFENPQKAQKDFEFLREGKGLLGQKQFDQKTIGAFIEIEGALIAYLKKSLNPGLVLQNFVRIIKNSSFPSIWYKEFTDKKFFGIFLNLCEFSQKAVDLFAEDKKLREYFLTRNVFLKINTKSLRELDTKTILFTLSVQFTLGLIKYENVSKILSKFFREKINQTAQQIINSETKFFIAAMGSFGSSEMTFASDIDLVFVVKNSNSEIDIQKEFQELLINLKNDFKPFDVDCRLRPEGKNSQLVWELEGYKNYIAKRARTWEFQAFTKLNFITGKIVLFKNFISEIEKAIRLNKNIRNDIFSMRKKIYPSDLSSLTKIINIRRSRGGTADIEFIVQLILLENPELFKKYRAKGNLKILADLSKNKKYKTLLVLKNNFNFLKTLELNNQNIFNIASSTVKENVKENEMLAFKMNLESAIKFKKHLIKILKINNSFFEKYFEEDFR